MKLYFDKLAPNVRRVQMFIAEKGLSFPCVEMNIAAGEHRTPEFLSKNPLGQLPVLEIENGSCISESMAICRYLDERYPRPSLFGRGAEERALIHMWARRAENLLFTPSVEFGHHSHPAFRGQIRQVSAYAEICQGSIESFYALLDTRLSVVGFIGGESFSVADVVAFCGLELARVWRVSPDPSLASLLRWHQRVLERPSSSIARYL